MLRGSKGKSSIDNEILFYTDLDFERELDTVEWTNHPTEDERKFRTPFWRDYARILHSPSFRRLKGKTQLFPGYDSDFYRCRLTHSLEVAEIGKSIANYLNFKLQNIYNNRGYKTCPLSFIDTDLIQACCIAHDIGHPPFGHQGEFALDKKMLKLGGFEGNAQTLRILSRLEKKEYAKADSCGEQEEDELNFTGFSKNGIDLRKGLNLTFRTLASVLKYNNKIPHTRIDNTNIVKGYFQNEEELISKIINNVAPSMESSDTFKTIECSIMDLADDIAYSVYDIEDSFKSGFTDPLSFLTAINANEAIEGVAKQVKKTGDILNISLMKDCSVEDVVSVIYKLLIDFSASNSGAPATVHTPYKNKMIASNGYLRTKLSTELVTKFIYSTDIELNDKSPALSKVIIPPEIQLEIEVLKRLTYQFQITSSKLKIIETRGQSIVSKLFEILYEEGKFDLLPYDVKSIVYRLKSNNKESEIPRIICDFIAGMTDKYAVDYYNRLTSSSAISMHIPID